MNKKIFAFLIIAIIVLAAILTTGFLVYEFLIIGKSNNNLSLSKDCKKIFNEIKNNNPEELADLYDDIKLKRVDPSLVFTACDFGPEEVFQACMEREKIYQDKLICTQNLLNNSDISKEDLLKIKEF